jgi:hypothetical protein
MTVDTTVRAQPGQFWTVALRRQPVRIVGGEPEGGYTDAYELICCDCGDNPDLDYLDVAPEVQQVRGPYPLPAGVTAYVHHVKRYHVAPAELDGFRQTTAPVRGESGGPKVAMPSSAVVTLAG